MAFPPKFCDLGKKTKDLFKKTYDFKNELKVISKTEQGYTFETTGFHVKGIAGNSKVSWTDKTLGAFELEANSKGECKGKLVSKKKSDVGVTIETSCNEKTTTASAEAAYAKDSLSATVKGNYKLTGGNAATTVNAAAVMAHDGVAVGGSVEFNTNNPSTPTDFNIGAECVQKDLTVTVVTSDQLNDITFSYFQTVNDKLNLGANLCVKPDQGQRLFTFGGEYGLDKFTSFKFKADSAGIVGTTATHSISNPAVKVQASAEFNTQGSDVFAPQKYGLSLCFGDF